MPTVSTLKAQQDTIATVAELTRIGIAASKVKIVFNLVDDHVDLEAAFETVLAYAKNHPPAQANTSCRLGANEIYERVKGSDASLADLASDDADYKALIAAASNAADELAWAQKLATRRLATRMIPELDACFAALELR